jgi:hypothetical protein
VAENYATVLLRSRMYSQSACHIQYPLDQGGHLKVLADSGSTREGRDESVTPYDRHALVRPSHSARFPEVLICEDLSFNLRDSERNRPEHPEGMALQ